MWRSRHFQTLGKATVYPVINLLLRLFFFFLTFQFQENPCLWGMEYPRLWRTGAHPFMQELCSTSCILTANRKVWKNQTHTVEGPKDGQCRWPACRSDNIAARISS